MSEVPEITPDMIGCWLDGSFGWINTYRIIEMAETYGFELDEIHERPLLERYGRNEHGYYGIPAPTNDESETIDVIADEAFEFMCDKAPAGYTFERGPDGVSMLPVCESEDFEPKYESCAHCEPEEEPGLKQRLYHDAEDAKRHYRLTDHERQARQYMNELRS